MDYIKLAWSNLKFIIRHADLLALRLILSLASIVWAWWALVISSPLANFTYFSEISDSFPSARLWLWGFLFFLFGTAMLVNLLLRLKDKFLDIATSLLGVILWSGSTILVMITRSSEYNFPMGGAHWAVVTMAWWSLYRDITTIK